MAELFGSSKPVISYHLRNIFETKELAREATVKEILTVQDESGRKVARNVKYYNLWKRENGGMAGTRGFQVNRNGSRG